MALSTVVDSTGSVTGHSNNIEGSANPSSLPQVSDTLESEPVKVAVRLPNMDKRKPLKMDAKDLMTDLDSDQQQQSFLSSTSASSSTFDHTATKVTLLPSQQIQEVKKSFDASYSVGPRGRGGIQGIKAARQRFLLDKAAKQQEAKTASEVLKVRGLTSEMSSKSSVPILDRSGASTSSSSTSSTSQTSAQEKAMPQPMFPFPPQALYTQNPTSFSTVSNGFHNQSSSHGRSNSAIQHPVPQRSNNTLYLSSAMVSRERRVQNDWANNEYLFVKVCDLPDSTTTRDLWAALKHEGHIAHIRLYENAKGHRDGGASVKFRYASSFASRSSLRNN